MKITYEVEFEVPGKKDLQKGEVELEASIPADQNPDLALIKAVLEKYGPKAKLDSYNIKKTPENWANLQKLLN